MGGASRGRPANDLGRMIIEHQPTVNYFDNYTPEYSLERVKFAIDVIKDHGKRDSSLVDVGCGVGNVLKFIKEETSIGGLCGIDVSQACLEKASKNAGCETFLSSVTDTAFMESFPKKFDFVLLMGVLHHLVGKTRKDSKLRAMLAVANALKLLKTGGHLMLVEPSLYPSFANGLVFYVKKAATKISSKRIQIFGQWNNIGAPVVSYYTNEELIEMIKPNDHCEVESEYYDEQKVTLVQRLGLITRRLDTTIVVEKKG